MCCSCWLELVYVFIHPNVCIMCSAESIHHAPSPLQPTRRHVHKILSTEENPSSLTHRSAMSSSSSSPGWYPQSRLSQRAHVNRAGLFLNLLNLLAHHYRIVASNLLGAMFPIVKGALVLVAVPVHSAKQATASAFETYRSRA